MNSHRPICELLRSLFEITLRFVMDMCYSRIKHVIKRLSCPVVRRLYIRRRGHVIVVMPHGWIGLENNHLPLRGNTEIDAAKIQSYPGHEVS